MILYPLFGYRFVRPFITGVDKGTAKITVTANEGKTKAQVNVKVNEYDLVFIDTEPQSERYFFSGESRRV